MLYVYESPYKDVCACDIPSVGRRVGGACHSLPAQLYPRGPG